MDKDLFNGLVDKKISLLLDNPKPGNNGKESYVGILKVVTDDFLMLWTPENTRIECLIVKLKMILSVWVYKNNG